MLVTKVRGDLSWRKCRKEKSKKRKKAATQEGLNQILPGDIQKQEF